MIPDYQIIDTLDAAEQRAIEVEVRLSGQTRWCYFLTPEAITSCGDFVPGTTVRMHLGERHMIVVARVSRVIIEAILLDLARTGELERHTLALRHSVTQTP